MVTIAPTPTGNIQGSQVVNFLHSGPDRKPAQPAQINPQFLSLNLQQVRQEIRKREDEIITLKQQIQPLPPKQFTTVRQFAGFQTRSFTGGTFFGGRGTQFPVYQNIQIETNTSRQARGRVSSANASINNRISKLQAEIKQLMNQEEQIIKLQSQIKQQKEEEQRLRAEQQAREKSFFDQLGDAIAGAIPQQKPNQTFVDERKFLFVNVEQKPEEKKPSNLPLIAGAGLVLGALVL